MEYSPTGRNSMRYSPSPLLSTERESAVPALVAVTWAFGTAAPLGSVTVPMMVPVVTCARIAGGRRRTRQIVQAKGLIFIFCSLLSYSLLYRNVIHSFTLETAHEKPGSRRVCYCLGPKCRRCRASAGHGDLFLLKSQFRGQPAGGRNHRAGKTLGLLPAD